MQTLMASAIEIHDEHLSFCDSDDQAVVRVRRLSNGVVFDVSPRRDQRLRSRIGVLEKLVILPRLQRAA